MPPKDATPEWASAILKSQKDTQQVLAKTQEELKKLQAAAGKRKREAAPDLVFTKRSCREQHAFLTKMESTLDDIAEATAQGTTDVSSLVDSGKRLISEKIEQLRIADKFGWPVLDAYLEEDVVDSDDKRKRLARAQQHVLKTEPQLKASSATLPQGEGGRVSPSPSNHESFRTRRDNRSITCYSCGERGHVSADCRARRSGGATSSLRSFPSRK